MLASEYSSLWMTPTQLVLFGYLSRVCPHLEHVCIRTPFINLKSSGALPLLNRLQKLERLTLDCRTIDVSTSSDLEWIRRLAKTTHLIKTMKYLSLLLALRQPWKPTQRIKTRLLAREEQYQDHEEDMIDVIDAIDMTNVGHKIDFINWSQERNAAIEHGVVRWLCLNLFELRYERRNGEQETWAKPSHFQSLRHDARVDIWRLKPATSAQVNGAA